MSLFAPSKFLVLTVAAAGALGAFTPLRYAMTSWDTPASSAGVRLYGSTPDRSGILELSLNGQLNASSTPPYPWHANIHLLGTVSTASGSDFAAISTQGGGKVVVFFIRNNGALSYIQSPNTSTAAWTLGLVGGSPKPAPGTSLGAAMWGPNHMSVFYQDTEGIIFESEFNNGTWATPVDFAVANVGTDISAVGTTRTSGLSKFVYSQSVRRLQEWRYSSSNGQWTPSTIEVFPVQSSDDNIRLAVSYLAGNVPTGRIRFRPATAKGIGLLTGTPGGIWNSGGALSTNMTVNSDVAHTFQFPGGALTNWEWLVFTGADGTLQQRPYRAGAGWGVPSQILPAPNKIKGAT